MSKHANDLDGIEKVDIGVLDDSHNPIIDVWSEKDRISKRVEIIGREDESWYSQDRGHRLYAGIDGYNPVTMRNARQAFPDIIKGNDSERA